MWLSHLTGRKSGYLSEPNKSPTTSAEDAGHAQNGGQEGTSAASQQSSSKKKKLVDGMDTTDIDESSFFWIGKDDLTSPTSSGPPSSASSPLPSSTTSTVPALYPSLTSSNSFLSSFAAPSPLSSGTSLLRSSRSSPSLPSTPPPPYPGRPSTASALPVAFPSAHADSAYPYQLGAHSAALTTASHADGGIAFQTPAYAALSHSSFMLNPRIAALRKPTDPMPSAVWDKLKEVEAKLKQGSTYDPCFEAEVVAQIKHDRHVQEDKASGRKERHRKHVELMEAETKRLQDIAITEWVEQQQRKQPPLPLSDGVLGQTLGTTAQHEGKTAGTSTPSSSNNAGILGLIDLDFPSTQTSPQSQIPLRQSSTEQELPPPYPGGPHAPPTSASINFSVPSSSRFLPNPITGAFVAGFSNATPTVVTFPTPPSQQAAVVPVTTGSLHSSLSFVHHPAYSPYSPSPLALATPTSSHYVTSLGTMQPTLPMTAPVVPSHPSSQPKTPVGAHTPNLASASSSTVTTTAITPQRTTMEEYQRKYPVLSNPERRTIFIKMLEMRFKPEIVAMGLEVFPDPKLDRIVTFVSNFHKLAEMGYATERIKQALLLYDDLPKAIVYLEELDKLVKGGLKEAQIFDAFALFDNDIEKASAFLRAYKALAQFGFDDLHIREALLMCDNSQDKAAHKVLGLTKSMK